MQADIGDINAQSFTFKRNQEHVKERCGFDHFPDTGAGFFSFF
jgi:hypothetical protein